MRHARGAYRFLALLALAGCMVPHYPKPGEKIAPGVNEALVFGRVHHRNNGHDVIPGGPSFVEQALLPPDPMMKISLFAVEASKRAVYMHIEEDGTFYWLLPSGTYLVYVTPRTAGPRAGNQVVAAFQVAPGSATVYVGRLDLSTSTEFGPSEEPVEFTVDAVEVADESAAATRRLHERYPDLTGPVETRPMITDEALETLFANYSRERCEIILGRHGLRVPPRSLGANDPS